MINQGEMKSSGILSLKVIRNTTKAPLSWQLKNRLRWNFILGWLFYHLAFLFTRVTGLPVIVSKLSLIVKVFPDEESRTQYILTRDLFNHSVSTGALATAAHLKRILKRLESRRVSIDYGTVGYKVVTDTGVAFIVDAFQNIVELENMKYHGIGTGSTAEGAGESALVTELTTEYTPDNVRATGTTIEGATANIFRTVATNTLSGGGALLREHGVFSQAAVAGGVLLDRTLFALITLADGDSLQSTYDLTLTSGG